LRALARISQETDPLQRLALAVIDQAVRDATWRSSPPPYLPEDLPPTARHRLEFARRWLTTHGAGLELWSELSGLEYEAVIDRCLRLLWKTMDVETEARRARNVALNTAPLHVPIGRRTRV